MTKRTVEFEINRYLVVEWRASCRRYEIQFACERGLLIKIGDRQYQWTKTHSYASPEWQVVKDDAKYCATLDNFTEIADWCDEQDRKYTSMTVLPRKSALRIVFRNDKDAALFKLFHSDLL